jgi:cytochrome c
MALTIRMAGAMEEAPYPEAFEVCRSCHAYQAGEEALEGPTLSGVVGRRIASIEGYDYSPALRRLPGTWDRATLDRFLADPKAFAPGTRMTLGGLRRAADRASVIAFLESRGAAQRPSP